MKDKFYIFGLMRSGTNAFSKYSLNLGIRCLNDPFLNGNCDYNDKVLDEPPVCWKHSIPTLISTEYPIVICFKDKDSQYKSLQKAWDKSVNDLAYNKAIDDCLKEFCRVWEMLPKQLNYVAKKYEKTLLNMKK